MISQDRLYAKKPRFPGFAVSWLAVALFAGPCLIAGVAGLLWGILW